jgi:hypothetical protein
MHRAKVKMERKYVYYVVRNKPLYIIEVNFVLKVSKMYWNTNFYTTFFPEILDSIFLSEVKIL